MKNKILFIIISFLINILFPIFSIPLNAQGEITSVSCWQEIESKYAIIRYQSLEDLKKFDQKIDYKPAATSLKKIFASAAANHFTGPIKEKTDAVFERVREILGMYKDIEKVSINVYHNKEQLHGAFHGIYKRECCLRAWYIFEQNTIYINVNDLNEGMLAHEMAHAIIDNYLTVRPPTASAEILARYVDAHLFR